MIVERMYGTWDMTNAINAVADRDCNQKSMAGFYADVIRSGATDVKALNAAIVARWPKGLERIKTMAWKEVRG